MFRRYLSLSFVPFAVALGPPLALALDESRLWLPSNYERLYLDLRASARAAEKLERCEKVIRGTIDTNQSTKEHPIFLIKCRQPNGRTYNEMVDGLTKETLSTPYIPEVVPSEQDMEAIRIAEEQQRLLAEQERKDMFLAKCMEKFDYKTKLFDQRKLLVEQPEPNEFTMDRAKFYLDFDAVDVHGVELHYRGICVVEFEGGTQLYMRKRR